MPTVEDFPPIGQRAVQGNQERPLENNERSVGDKRKSGFFSRLTGMHRRPADSRAAPEKLDQDLNSQQDQDVPLPVFFGRERR